MFIIAYTAYTDEEKSCKKAGMDYFCKFYTERYFNNILYSIFIL